MIHPNPLNVFDVHGQKEILPGLVDCKKSLDVKNAVHALKNKHAFAYVIRGSRDKNNYCTITFKDRNKKIVHVRCKNYDEFLNGITALYKKRNHSDKKNSVPLTVPADVHNLLAKAAKPPLVAKPQAPLANPSAHPELDPIDFQGKTFPKHVVSKAGILSSEAFMKWVSTQPEGEKDELLKWGFQQRKFPRLGRACVLGRPGMKMLDGEAKGRICDEKGYAVSPYPGPVAQLCFVADKDVKEVYPCQSVTMLTDAIPMGKYQDGKVMLQQQAIRSCVPTCAAMLLLERGYPCNLKALTDIDLATDQQCLAWINESGLKGNLIKGEVSLEKLKGLLEKHGSLTCSINEKEMGSHQIVLDHIDKEYAIIRDPYHGRRIRISTMRFMAMTPVDYIYLTEK